MPEKKAKQQPLTKKEFEKILTKVTSPIPKESDSKERKT